MSLAAASQSLKSSDSDDSIRVMVVDDSAVVGGLVSRWIGEEEGLKAVARHSNGQLAVKDIAKSNPDVVVLDIEMPVMDGLTALPLLLKEKPGVKVIMASTLTRRNAEISLKALSLGATDYVPKPESNRGITTSSEFRQDLINKIKAISPRHRRKNKTISALASAGKRGLALSASGLEANKAFALRPFSNVTPRIVAIGTSTGGPQALMSLFKTVSAVTSRVPIVITQHMPETFTAILAEHLSRATGCPAKEGANNEPLQPGHIYVAPGGRHMLVAGNKSQPAISINDGPEVNFCKPSVDPLFKSVAKIFGPASLGIVLTGMGHDGASGSGFIVNAGGSVIAQDEETSVVWGMPGATVQAGHCCTVLPLDKIGPKIMTLLKGGVV